MNKRINCPVCLPIERITSEGPGTITLDFKIPSDFKIDPKPGQYFMLWNPGDDEIPISISRFYGENHISFTICSEGVTSNNLIQKKKYELIGLRGPFGNGFELIEKGMAILVAGGMGIAPLRYLLSFLLRKKNIRIILIQGAKTKHELFFKNEIMNFPIEINFCTEDGSYGFNGFPTEILSEILDGISDAEITEIYACGPEKMLLSILKLVQKKSLEEKTQFSLADRYIRCGFGLCGSCVLDDSGLTICHDGPVIRGDLLVNVKDFGLYGRSSNGSKYPL